MAPLKIGNKSKPRGQLASSSLTMKKGLSTDPKARTLPARPRNGTAQETTADLILATTEKLMLTEGYAAVSTRRVASEAGIKAPLVHYYFATTDDLFLALFRRVVERVQKEYDEALLSKQPLRAVWNVASGTKRTALTFEFMALANHRKAIHSEIAASTERARQQLMDALSRLIDPAKLGADALPLVGATVVMAAIGRTLVMESGVGISMGHAEVESFVEHWLRRLEGPAE